MNFCLPLKWVSCCSVRFWLHFTWFCLFRILRLLLFVFFLLILVQSPLFRRLWGPVRRLETLHPDANPRQHYPGIASSSASFACCHLLAATEIEFGLNPMLHLKFSCLFHFGL